MGNPLLAGVYKEHAKTEDSMTEQYSFPGFYLTVSSVLCMFCIYLRRT